MPRAARKGNMNWRQEVESWGPRLKQEQIEAARKGLDLRLQHAKPRLKAPRRLRIEVFTNRPINDPVANEWKMMKIEAGPRYTMNEIYHKVRSRWKDKWKVDWKEERMDPWMVWGQEGRLDPDQVKDWIEGERFMLLVQQKGDHVIEEMQMEELLKEGNLWEKFLRGGSGKRKDG